MVSDNQQWVLSYLIIQYKFIHAVLFIVRTENDHCACQEKTHGLVVLLVMVNISRSLKSDFKPPYTDPTQTRLCNMLKSDLPPLPTPPNRTTRKEPLPQNMILRFMPPLQKILGLLFFPEVAELLAGERCRNPRSIYYFHVVSIFRGKKW